MMMMMMLAVIMMMINEDDDGVVTGQASYWEGGLVSAVELIQVFLSEKKLMISLADI